MSKNKKIIIGVVVGIALITGIVIYVRSKPKKETREPMAGNV